MRLDKYLCDAGFGTRSEVKNLIKKGRVKMASANELGQDFASMQPVKDPGWKNDNQFLWFAHRFILKASPIIC